MTKTFISVSMTVVNGVEERSRDPPLAERSNPHAICAEEGYLDQKPNAIVF